MLLLDYQKSVQPFSFPRILLQNDKMIIAQILQLQCLLFGKIVSTSGRRLVIDSYSSPT